MSVRPTGIVAGGVEVWHDEAGHGGVVAWADVDFARRPDGQANTSFVTLPCPVAGCGAVSVHPVSGGADRAAVQELHARHLLRRAAALGLDVPDLAAARAWVRQRAIEQDGPRAVGEEG